MDLVEIPDKIPFMYSFDENINSLNNIIIPQVKALFDEEDTNLINDALESSCDKFICLEKNEDEYKLVGYLAFSHGKYGHTLVLEFIYGDDEMIDVLLQRFKVYVLDNRYTHVSGVLQVKQVKQLDIFIKNGYTGGDLIFDQVTENMSEIYIYNAFIKYIM